MNGIQRILIVVLDIYWFPENQKLPPAKEQRKNRGFSHSHPLTEEQTIEALVTAALGQCIIDISDSRCSSRAIVMA